MAVRSRGQRDGDPGSEGGERDGDPGQREGGERGRVMAG